MLVVVVVVDDDAVWTCSGRLSNKLTVCGSELSLVVVNK